ncbi:alpha-hydroxy acid oxidase [Roseibium album]|uniref:alpha-hydroxy acid oxidase n=1 Tax=Roseibium album TaxID=311410 RepID=UPI00248F976F|nr:alpha-hydroxy acid oxidase [Roseibium album]
MFSTEDARQLASRRQPRLIFDFVEGAAGREFAAAQNIRKFEDVMLQPKVMEDVAHRTLLKPFLGKKYDLPFGIAPMGMCNLSWPNADYHLAQAAKHHNIPVCLSSAASSSIEEMWQWAGKNAWFQLYAGQSVEQSLSLIERAGRAGYDTVILTADVPQVSRRVRDLRNGFHMPFRMTPKLLLDFVLHPRWSLATLFNGAPEPKNFKTANGTTQFDRSASRASADWKFLERLRAEWPGNLVVKGVTSPADAVRIQQAGVDAVYVSNHGGRQLDSVPAAIDILPQIRTAVGPDYPLIFDSGIRNGEDIVKALARGADFVMIGRPVLYALGADGARGLNTLLSIFAEEVSLTLAQLGLSDVADVDAEVLVRPDDTNTSDAPVATHFNKKLMR